LKSKTTVVVVGSANVDLTCFTDRFPEAGETLFGEQFDLGFGGKGANQAVAASYCGADAHLVARVGDDLFGPATIDNCKSLGIGARYVKMLKGVSSGVAPIFVDKTGQNRIVVVNGANDKVSPRDVDEAAPLLARADTIVLQFEIPMRTVLHTIRFAKRHGIRCILNPAPARPVDLETVRDVDYFIPNETEATAVTGLPVNTIPQVKTCARALLDAGLSRVIITLGARGAIVAGPEGITRVPAFKVDTKDTTGAGDAFIGSFAVFLAEGLAAGRSELDAVARANLYAGLSTMGVGTQKSFPKRSRFDREWRARKR
jgi:ribokinase